MPIATIRKSGNANIISIPKTILKLLGLNTGDQLDVEIDNGKIILQPHHHCIEDLLANTNPSSFQIQDDDAEWERSVQGNEI